MNGLIYVQPAREFNFIMKPAENFELNEDPTSCGQLLLERHGVARFPYLLEYFGGGCMSVVYGDYLEETLGGDTRRKSGSSFPTHLGTAFALN